MTTVDRRRWLAQRIQFLEGQLAGDVSENERADIQVELDKLRKERGGGPLWRLLVGLPRRPTDR